MAYTRSKKFSRKQEFNQLFSQAWRDFLSKGQPAFIPFRGVSPDELGTELTTVRSYWGGWKSTQITFAATPEEAAKLRSTSTTPGQERGRPGLYIHFGGSWLIQGLQGGQPIQAPPAPSPEEVERDRAQEPWLAWANATRPKRFEIWTEEHWAWTLKPFDTPEAAAFRASVQEEAPFPQLRVSVP